MNKNVKCVQVLLWMWFGTITYFSAVSVVNIAKLETEVQNQKEYIQNIEKINNENQNRINELITLIRLTK